ncbi:MAG TPA: YfcE family phosphodiesterase [Miltoncostaea sp.]|nr:YfcE family phosphodiesterase [Miltoncostaea sp.]
MRIGVLADTHVGEHLPTLPPEVLERFDGVDLIVHAGDIAVPRVLEELAEVAPVAAVRGNHDRGTLRRLPLSMVIPAGAFRIGVTHGMRRARLELPSSLMSVAAGRPVLLGFARQMVGRFTDVDMVITGHLHLSFDHEVDGVRHFSPGAVFVNEMLHGRIPEHGPAPWAYRRYRKRIDDGDRLPADGFVTAGPDGLTAERVVLERPIPVQRPPRRRPTS